MPVKKVPQTENRQKLRIPLQGSPTLTSSPHTFSNNFVQGEKYVNCFPVEIPQFGGEPIKVLNKAPGLDTSPVTLTVSQIGPLGAIGWSSLGQILQYFDPENVFVSSNGVNTYIGTNTGGIITPEVQISSPGNSGTTSPICKIYNSGTASPWPYWFFYINYNGSTANLNIIRTDTWAVSTTAVASPPWSTSVNATPPIYMNNRVFWLDPLQNLIYNTDPISGAPTYTVGNFIAPQIQADNFVGLVKYRNHLCAIGQKSIEFFYDGGLSLGSPLVRQEQYLIRHGCNQISNVVTYGDIIYFLGMSDEFGWGLYEVANFNLRKVSSIAIDAFLNNIDDYVGQASPMVSMNIVDIFGHAIILFSFVTPAANQVNISFEIPKRPYGIMAPTDGQWWEWPAVTTIPQSVTKPVSFGNRIYAYPLIFHTSPGIPVSGNTGSAVAGNSSSTPYNNVPSSFYFTYPTNTTAVPVFISKNRQNSSSTTGTYVTNIIDFDENNWKHIDYIDCIGDFGNNTVTLSWTNDPTYQTSNWVQASTQSQSTNGPKNTLRWHNPGPFRQLALRYDFTGTSNMVYKGTEISFNMGTL